MNEGFGFRRINGFKSWMAGLPRRARSSWYLYCGFWLVSTSPVGAEAPRGWGIDACITAHVDRLERGRYLRLLEDSGVGVLRERGPNASMEELKAADRRVVAFVQLPGLTPTMPGNVLAENLRAVYEAARVMARTHAAHVDAWEMVGEPDVGYCPDLPDRLAAYQKALYLGIKAGAGEGGGDAERRAVSAQPDLAVVPRSTLNVQPASLRSPLVLMGALALPPGPWLARAMRNDLLDYTDAYNFHFYGHAADLAGVIGAHERAARTQALLKDRSSAPDRPLTASSIPAKALTRGPSFHKISARAPAPSPGYARPTARALPLWITECGLNAIAPGDFLNGERRALQATFTVSTARQALASHVVAVFMPFILAHRGDPHALTQSADQPLPAWTAYAEYTRQHPWPQRPWGRDPITPNPVVLQWLPDNTTTVPHKVSGTYRFMGDQPIRGALRLYNFSSEPKRGYLTTHPAVEVIGRGLPAAEIIIPAQGEVSLPMEFRRAHAGGYFRAEWSGDFIERGGARSRVAFGLEAWPEANDFEASAVPLRSQPEVAIRHPSQPEYAPGERAGVWQTMNGLHLTAQPAEGKATRLQAWVTEVRNDPLHPTMAVAAIQGLPADGFLRVELNRPMSKGATLRVDLVDRTGQRFTIWENFGVSYLRPSADVWLNFKDFGVYFWGRCTESPEFRPEEIEEIQLRFDLATVNAPMDVALSIMRPKVK